VTLALVGKETEAQRDYNRCLSLDRSLAKVYEPLFQQAKAAARRAAR
jgi:hypothetical protein